MRRIILLQVWRPSERCVTRGRNHGLDGCQPFISYCSAERSHLYFPEGVADGTGTDL